MFPFFCKMEIMLTNLQKIIENQHLKNNLKIKKRTNQPKKAQQTKKPPTN